MKFLFSDIMQHLSIKMASPGSGEAEIDHVHFDSRRMQKNGLFVALSKGQADGHHFIKQAIENGAVLVAVERETEDLHSLSVPYVVVADTEIFLQELASAYRLCLSATVVGVTGSNGKTTTKDIVAGLLSKKFRVHKTQGNYNNHLGLPLTILQADPDVEVLILEMGMNHAGEIDVIAKIAKPDYGIITNIGESHIEHLGSKENIAHAKGEMFPHLKKGGVAYIPSNCAFKELLAAKTKEEKIFFGVLPAGKDAVSRSEQTITAHSIDMEEGYTAFSFETSNGEQQSYWIPLYGEHNVQNVLPAIDIAMKKGFTETDIVEGLKEIAITPMRFEKVNGNNGVLIINDAYNASPTSMLKSTDTFLNLFQDKHRVLVLGDMYELGENTEAFHREVGKQLNQKEENIGCLVTIGEHSKYLHGMYNGDKRHFSQKEEASQYLQLLCHEQVAILFKASRGMKLEEVIEKIKA